MKEEHLAIRKCESAVRNRATEAKNCVHVMRMGEGVKKEEWDRWVREKSSKADTIGQ